MISFTINLKKLNNSIENYKYTKKTLLEQINSAYENLKNVDAAWNDSNSVLFIDKIKKDKYEINSYFSNFDKVYLEIENLKNGFNSIVSKYGYASNSVKLKFNENNINIILKKMNNIIDYLSSALYYINLCNFNNDVSTKKQVQDLIDSIKNISSDISVISSSINKLKRQVINLLLDSQQSFRNINDLDLNIELTRYSWSLKNPEIKITKSDI